MGVGVGSAAVELPERLTYRLKRRFLGAPLTNDQLSEERLSTPIALGVLAPDCISSSAYGTEEILIELLPVAGLGAFVLLLPIGAVIIAILVLTTLSYREVVSVYTKAGGSYVVARENFGPRVAQIAAVALLIDYVVTVAVQAAAGTVAVASAIPAVGPYSVELTVAVVLLLAYGNLRGIKEAGRAFAFPTYFFAAAMGVVIVVGLARAVFGSLPVLDPYHLKGVNIGQHHGLLMGASVLILLRAFANGGSSLTGLEAISNGVSAFRKPEGTNARRALVVMSCTLGFLVIGVTVLAYLTHASPYTSGYPSIISQETQLVFGQGPIGQGLFYLVQAATALILYTGANTSFNGFPFLASFVADDAFLPRQLRRRGHRLVFSNAIIVLTILAVVLLLVTGANVNSLVPFYAIGVFTGFTMAGFGMVRHHRRLRESGWRRKLVINAASGTASLIIVGIFAIVKFTEGAWLVVVLFPIGVFALIKLNKEYRREEAALATVGGDQVDEVPRYSRHIVLVLVDAYDLATLEAVRYGKTLRGTELRAVHFVLDSTRSHQLLTRWEATGAHLNLELVDCPDRRLGRGVLDLISHLSSAKTRVTVLLPRRSYSPLFGRLLHDRTADRIARVISRLPHASATIVPYDAAPRLEAVDRGQIAVPAPGPDQTTPAPGPDQTTPAAVPNDGANVGRPERTDTLTAYRAPRPPVGATGAGQLQRGVRVQVEGRVRSVRLASIADTPVFTCDVVDSTGSVTAMFYGRRQIRGIEAGSMLRLDGRVSQRDGSTVLANPRYELLPKTSP